LFIADWQNRRVRKVSTNGIITTVAGNGTSTYSGDGGLATNAGVTAPWGLAVDGLGNLFIADYLAGRIRKVDTNGIIRSVAGGGSLLTDGIIATNATLSGPTGVAVDGFGNLVIASSSGNRIRKVSTSGIIATVAGNRIAGYSGDGGPATNATTRATWGAAIDSSGNLLFADNGNHAVRRVTPSGIIDTVAGTGIGNYSGDGGPAAEATMCHPAGIALDQFGNLFVAEYDNHCIRKVTNTQGATLALNNVRASDAGNYRVVVTSASGSVTSQVATLTVATSPLIYDTSLNPDGSLTISCISLPNSTNELMSSTDLSSATAWQTVSTNVAAIDGNWQFTEPKPAGLPARFYRFFTP
jgi:NHL repeat